MNFDFNKNLAILKDCDPVSRLQHWKERGGTLKGNTRIGCGLNSLTFLGIFTYEQGEQLVEQVTNEGTNFLEIMQYVAKFNNKSNTSYIEFLHPLDNLEQVTAFFR